MAHHELTREKIGRLLRKGEPFLVFTIRERKHALDGAVFMGIKVTTRKLGNTGAFKVLFI